MGKKEFKFDLGTKAKCRITGFSGVVVARTEWLNGCFRYNIQAASLSKDGKPGPMEGFDEEQLESTDNTPLIKPDTDRRPGGPRPAIKHGK